MEDDRRPGDKRNPVRDPAGVVDPHSPPPRPWKYGRHDGHTVFRLQVNVCETDKGWVFSEHTFLTQEDESIARTLPSGGARQIAHALFHEAVIREVFFDAIELLSEDPAYLKRYAEGTPEVQREVELRLYKAARDVMGRTVNKTGLEAAKGVLQMMSNRQASREGPNP